MVNGDRDCRTFTGSVARRRGLLDGWTTHMAKFGLMVIKATALLQDLVVCCLNEHDDLLVTRAAAPRNHNAISQIVASLLALS